MLNFLSLIFFIVIFSGIRETLGHGMLLDPPGRSSRWRYDRSARVNYNDNSLNCGGFFNQWNLYSGNCGLCGDDYGIPKPRPNELGGFYGGSGVIVKTYRNAYTAKVGLKITANLRGYIYFNLCNLDEFGHESETCFTKYYLRFADGSDRFYIGKTIGLLESEIVFPEGLSCKHCVLRWTYIAGNNWGACSNGTGAFDCGPQENFMSCADINIIAPSYKTAAKLVQKEVETSLEV